MATLGRRMVSFLSIVFLGYECAWYMVIVAGGQRKGRSLRRPE